jgi:PHD/YefM family antitoxin component YafN of YafNO toxin-antitoxin module
MRIETDRMVTVTNLQRNLSAQLKKVADSGEPLFVLRNNEVESVVLSAREYEMLKEIEEAVEHLEIATVVEVRLKQYDRKRNIPWEKIKARHGL